MLMAIRIKATFTLRACTSQVANVIIVSFPFETRLNFHLSPFLTAGRDAAPHTSWMRTKDNTKTIPIIKNSRNNKSNIAAATTTVLFLIQTSSDANYQLSLVGIPLRHSVKEWMSFRLCWCWGWGGGGSQNVLLIWTTSLLKYYLILGDFGFTPRCKWNLRSSGLFYNADR